MANSYIEKPIHIESALGQDNEESIMTLAAYLITAGIWHNPELRELSLPPEEDLAAVGFDSWVTGNYGDQETYDLQNFNEFSLDENSENAPRYEYYSRLSELIQVSIRSGNPKDSASAVAYGLQSPDDIVRVCALTSALDLFHFKSLNFFQRLTWYFNRTLEETTMEILGVLLFHHTSFQYAGPPSAPSFNTPQSTNPGIMLIHGTVLPTSQTNRPTWSVPGTGPLFNHIHNLRTDIYGSPDYFRWEGGYTNYAREVASQNLHDWLQLHRLQGIDVVAHSHGCNVVMASTQLGAEFGKIVLLNCPVHWNKYSLPPKYYANTHSVHIRYDLVIMADRGAKQRFPDGTITEIILPFWFGRHSHSTTPSVWDSQNLNRLL